MKNEGDDENMGYATSIIYMLVFLAAGYYVSKLIFRDEKPAAIAMLTLTISTFLLMWLPALTSFLFGFTLAAQAVAVAVCALISLAIAVRGKKARHATRVKTDRRTGLRAERVMLCTVVPIALLTLYILHTHTLLPDAQGNLFAGQSTFGDMNLHAGFITSLTEQQFFPPKYSLLATQPPVGYPFLCDSVSATFYTLGAPLRFAYMLPMVPAILGLFMGVYLFFRAWLGTDGKASFATSIFLIGGGFGFARFFDMAQSDPGRFGDLMNGFYHTPTNFVEYNLRWVNNIADMFIPQRATLFGYAMLIPCLYLLVRAVFQKADKRYFIALGVIGGGLPLVHTHSFMSLALISLVCFAYVLVNARRDKAAAPVRPFITFGVIAAVLAVPQLVAFSFRQAGGEGFIRAQFNWVNHMDGYFWFYIKNLGLPYLLLIPAFIHADVKKRWLYGGGLLILALGEFIVFQPNEYDNNKILIIWFLLTIGLFANLCGDIFAALRAAKIRGAVFIAAAAIVVCNASGAMTLAREVASHYQLYSASHVEAAEFIRGNTDPDALFLTTNNHNNTVATLTGRTIYCGTSTFLYFHGIDYQDLEREARDMLTNPSLGAIASSGVDYVFVSDFENGLDGFDEGFFAENYPAVFDNGIVTIYEVLR
jgi:hypothetical protein